MTSAPRSPTWTMFVRLLWAGVISVALLRFFSATALGNDILLQIQAGQNLLEGKGLKVYEPRGTVLGQPLALHTLTHFPCGYSLYAALALKLGLSLVMLEKCYGLACTLLGWWGWASLSRPFLENGILQSARGKFVAGCFAVTAPLFFTLPWTGTDIFLWAATPWVCLWLSQAATAESRKIAAIRYAWVGFACGACFLARYASVVLVVYAALVIVLQSGRRYADLFRHGFVFACALAPALALQLYIDIWGADARATPGGVDPSRNAAMILSGLKTGVQLLPTANYLLFFWLPDRLLKWFVLPGTEAPWLYGFVLLLFAVPALALRRGGHRSLAAAFGDVRVIAAGLLAAVPLLLFACTALGEYPFISDYRYYRPCIPLIALLAAYFAGTRLAEAARWQRWFARFNATFFFAMSLSLVGGTFFLLAPNAHGVVQRRKLMADGDLATFPSLGVCFEFPVTRDYIRQRLADDPHLYVLMNFDRWFTADPTVDRARIHPVLRCEFFASQRVTGPLHLLVAVSDRDDRPLSIHFEHWDGRLLPAPCLEALPLRFVTRFPQEKMKILEGTLPAGATVVLQDKPQAESAR